MIEIIWCRWMCCKRKLTHWRRWSSRQRRVSLIRTCIRNWHNLHPLRRQAATAAVSDLLLRQNPTVSADLIRHSGRKVIRFVGCRFEDVQPSPTWNFGLWFEVRRRCGCPIRCQRVRRQFRRCSDRVLSDTRVRRTGSGSSVLQRIPQMAGESQSDQEQPVRGTPVPWRRRQMSGFPQRRSQPKSSPGRWQQLRLHRRISQPKSHVSRWDSSGASWCPELMFSFNWIIQVVLPT